MSLQLPAIDAHAHIQTSVRAADLKNLDAFVFAVTIHPREWEAALRRNDQLAIWGLGVHPARADAVRAFDAARLADAIEGTLLIGEIGLDGRAGDLAKQIVTLEAVLEAVAAVPRPVTLHSVAATGQVLELLAQRPIAAPILHWWRGSKAETEAALELGCFFSLNGAEAMSPKVLELLPPDRVLTETDFPHTRRTDRRAVKPASVSTIEAALGRTWSMDQFQLRRQLWRTLGEVLDRCDLLERTPARVQDLLLTVGTH